MKLADLLDRFESPEEHADGFLAVCPAHEDAHPSLRLALGRNGALLVKCRAGCETSDVLKASGLSFADLRDVEETGLAPAARSTSEPASPADVAALAVRLDGYDEALWQSMGPEADRLAGRALTYASERFGVGPSDAVRLGLGLATDLGGGPRLVVPFRDAEGVARGFQARALSPRAEVRWTGPRSPQGGSWSKVGIFPSGTGWEEVVVTEGPGDALTACAAGYDSVAVRGAALAGRDDVAAEIAAYASGRPVVVFGDADNAGRKFTRELVAGLARLGSTAVAAEPPAGGDLTAWRERDPDSFRDEFIGAVRGAIDRTPSRITARLDAFGDEDLTDLGMAWRLRDSIDGSGSGVRFTPEAGFFLLRLGVWRPDSLDEVRTRAQEVAASLWREARELEAELEGADDETKKREAKRVGRLRGFAKHANSTRGIDSMIRELRALRGVATRFEDFDRHHDRLAVLNGVVDLRTGRLLGHDPSLLLTRQVQHDYDPEAAAPRWERFLSEVFPAYPDLPAYIRRLVGYAVTGETREQCFAVHYGKGANGKSVFTDTLSEIFRELTVTTPFSTFEQKPAGGIPNDLAALKGARIVMASEGEQGRPMAESVLKRVTGRDLIAARFMRQEFFEFRPSFLLMLASNYKPDFRGQDEGLWRRVKLVPWERTFRPEERDLELSDELLTEAPGILAWAVQGAREWYSGGLQDPEVIRTGTKEYRETSDSLAGFFPGVFERAEEGFVLGEALWSAYREWTEAEGLQRKEQWTRRFFFSALEERGLVKRKRAQGVVFLGIRRARQTHSVLDHAAPERATPARLADVPTTGASVHGII